MWYEDLLNIDEIWNKKEYFNDDRGGVAYYCKTCEILVDVERPNTKWYTFICRKCKKETIVLGTKEWLTNNYRIK
jgi:hypothetical protein